MRVKDRRITRNAVKCGKCDDIIESVHRHDFRSCKCGAIAVDGGKEYLRRVGDIHNHINMSESEEFIREETDYERECREKGKPVPWLKEKDYVHS